MAITRDEALTDAVRRSAGGGSTTGPTTLPAPSHAAHVFRHLAGAELPEWPALAPHVRRRELAAGAPLFRAGEAQPFVYVLSQGVVKMVYETATGEAWVKGFAEPGLCFASVTALAPGGLTSFAAYAEVDCMVEQVEYARLLALAERHLPWQKALSEAFKRYGQRKEQRERELLTLSPEARYLGFLREHPALAAVLRQRDIASYVRITPVALSRIKARLKARGVTP